MPGTDPIFGLPIRSLTLELLEQEILGYDSNQRENQPFILDLVTLKRLYFQNIPVGIEYNAESTYEAIMSPGRNNPIYQFSGSEDTLEFELTWYCNHESRLDVIMKCKWLEALSKNNGFDEPPHLVQFNFGELFSDAKFIVSGAPYKLGRFQRDYGMMPAFATQRVTLKRVTDKNRVRSNIIKYNT
jgi:hypothetical protein